MTTVELRSAGCRINTTLAVKPELSVLIVAGTVAVDIINRSQINCIVIDCSDYT